MSGSYSLFGNSSFIVGLLIECSIIAILSAIAMLFPAFCFFTIVCLILGIVQAIFESLFYTSTSNDQCTNYTSYYVDLYSNPSNGILTPYAAEPTGSPSIVESSYIKPHNTNNLNELNELNDLNNIVSKINDLINYYKNINIYSYNNNICDDGMNILKIICNDLLKLNLSTNVLSIIEKIKIILDIQVFTDINLIDIINDTMDLFTKSDLKTLNLTNIITKSFNDLKLELIKNKNLFPISFLVLYDGKSFKQQTLTDRNGIYSGVFSNDIIGYSLNSDIFGKIGNYTIESSYIDTTSETVGILNQQYNGNIVFTLPQGDIICELPIMIDFNNFLINGLESYLVNDNSYIVLKIQGGTKNFENVKGHVTFSNKGDFIRFIVVIESMKLLLK
jgi:hypothetical protein